MSKIEVNTVAPQCGTTLTLGESGDTVTLGSGASQSGFGRTGTVDWQTTKKTTDFTAVNGEGYFVDTGSGVVTVTLPASPSAGNIVYVKDYDGNFATNKCTIARNGSNIRGATDNVDLEKDNSGVVCIYVDATEGWQLFFDGSDSDAQATFMTATGGTETTVNCGSCKVHTFTGPGTFSVSSLSDVPANNVISYMVVGGGGGGGFLDGGGGGAGGFREDKSPVTPYTASPLDGAGAITVTSTNFPITVGGGGAGSSPCGVGKDGTASTFSTITSAGGGGGGGHTSPREPGNAGGSGGGGSHGPGSPSGGAGNTPPVSPAQGFGGGAGVQGGSGTNAGGGGGGATAAGIGNPIPNSSPTKSQGGAGATTSINGTPTAYAGGGGGGMESNAPQNTSNVGGAGGGGAGSDSGALATAATANTGGGGGGGGYQAPGGPGGHGNSGGSGVVIIRYKIA
tara:strand:- start:695 stop:2053 length:1359 start_codon:yes stop_codon:yes gene_type:complete